MATQSLRTIQNPMTIFNGVTLTSAFSGNVSQAIAIGGADQIDLFCTFTPGTNGDNLDIQVEFSADSSTWFIDQASSLAAGVTTVVDTYFTRDGAAAATVYKFHITFPVSTLFMRLSLRYAGTGAGTASVIVQPSGV